MMREDWIDDEDETSPSIYQQQVNHEPAASQQQQQPGDGEEEASPPLHHQDIQEPSARADNCPAAMVRNGLPLTPSYTARALFGQQHSPLLDEIVSAFDNFEDSVSDEGVQISVTVSEENKHLLTHYTPLDELQTTSLGDSIGLDRFVNIHHDVLGETQPDHTDGEQDKDNLAIEVRCPVCLSRRKSIMCLPCTHMEMQKH
ncbi:hypothetical protein LSTR_LSTR007731 [Laodelphax striatellus]|uniref:Uncharacterized protein n=1 Tax=Laodelphax striatellus TaxID=195883 RepID=A0A482XJE5_LAOST|nr:hypothetical protein LSTR_LSTR007731 [Laodelphax striatellus]